MLYSFLKAYCRWRWSTHGRLRTRHRAGSSSLRVTMRALSTGEVDTLIKNPNTDSRSCCVTAGYVQVELEHAQEAAAKAQSWHQQSKAMAEASDVALRDFQVHALCRPGMFGMKKHLSACGQLATLGPAHWQACIPARLPCCTMELSLQAGRVMHHSLQAILCALSGSLQQAPVQTAQVCRQSTRSSSRAPSSAQQPRPQRQRAYWSSRASCSA